jgi:polyhydroxyalkanoate synthesis regulator phasin
MEFFQHIWGQALTTVAGAEDEAQRLLGRLQGVGHEEARRLSERLTSQRRDLEKRMEDVVKTSVAKLKVPRREEVEKLNTRLDALTKRLAGLSK